MGVNGTAGDDIISLSVSGGVVTAVVNGSPSIQNDALVTAVNINGLGGNDRIVIHSNGNNDVTINAGTGDDIIEIAPTTQDLANIVAAITINGEGGFDTANVFNSSTVLGASYIFNTPNQLMVGSRQFTVQNLESMNIQAGSGNDIFSLQAVPVLGLSLNGNAGTDSIQINFSGTQSVTYRPSGTTSGAGVLDLGVHDAAFTSCNSIACANLNTLQLLTPNGPDVLEVTQPNSINNRVTGTSGGVAFASLSWNSITNRVVLDVGLHDDLGPMTNTLNISGNMIGAPLLDLEAGSQVNFSNTHQFNVTGGTWAIQTNTFDNRRLWNANLSGGATVTFGPNEQFNRLIISSGAEARFSGLGNDLFDLIVADGTGSIEVAPGGLLDVFDEFEISTGATLRKLGAGSMIMGPAVTHTHQQASTLVVRGGIFRLNNDAGSPGSRNLALTADGGTAVLNSTQHLKGVFANAGTVRMLTNGNRVLVTESVGVNTEGGQIDLTDNDMIVDYTGATELENVRLLLRAGFANGAWNGVGINSSTAASAGITALGYAEASDKFTAFPAFFSGEQVDSTAVLVKYTYYGDSNLDGQTNLSDFNVLAANFGQSNRRWFAGDFDYNLQVNLADFNRLAGAFGQSGLRPAAPLPRAFPAAADDTLEILA